MARRLIYAMAGMLCPGCGKNLSDPITLQMHHKTPSKECSDCPHVKDPAEETMHDTAQFHADEARHIKGLHYRNNHPDTDPATRHVKGYEEGGHVYCSMACVGHDFCPDEQCPSLNPYTPVVVRQSVGGSSIVSK